jgi:spore maturation protein CgeB
MAAFGWCPSGRLFEAGACGTPIISDWWDGLDEFFVPDHEILIARTTDDVLAALDRSDADLAAIATAAREGTLARHTAANRAAELEALLSQRAE